MVTDEELEYLKDIYYEAKGWTKEGLIPKEKLVELGMDDVAEEIGSRGGESTMPTSTSKYQYITCDPEKCVGCQLCEYICSYTKTGEFNTYRSRIRTVRAHEVLITAVSLPHLRGRALRHRLPARCADPGRDHRHHPHRSQPLRRLHLVHRGL